METDCKRLSLIRFDLTAQVKTLTIRRITGIKDFVLMGGVSLENQQLIVGGRFGIFGPFADGIRKTKGATQ